MECARVWGKSRCTLWVQNGRGGPTKRNRRTVSPVPCCDSDMWSLCKVDERMGALRVFVCAVAHRPRSSLSLRDWRSSESCRKKTKGKYGRRESCCRCVCWGLLLLHGCLTFCVAATGVMGNEKKGAGWTFPCGVGGERILRRQRWLERLCVCMGRHALLLVSLTCGAACARQGCGSRRGSRGGPAAWQ
jgi:hypothetical protein